jgi:hypothetical protein
MTQAASVKRELPWTYSNLELFESCPRKYFHLRVVKDIVEPMGEAALWGNRVHDAWEKRIRDGVSFPSGMEHWEPLAKKIELLPGEKHTEQKLAIDRNFQSVNYYDKETAWTRGKVDLTIVNGSEAVLLDYKTGKPKPSEQLLLYCGYVFAKFRELTRISSAFVWLKTKKIEKNTISRDELSTIWQGFLPRVNRLDAAYEKQAWPPKPSGLCKEWCPVRSCEFNGKKGT